MILSKDIEEKLKERLTKILSEGSEPVKIPSDNFVDSYLDILQRQLNEKTVMSYLTNKPTIFKMDYPTIDTGDIKMATIPTDQLKKDIEYELRNQVAGTIASEENMSFKEAYARAMKTIQLDKDGNVTMPYDEILKKVIPGTVKASASFTRPIDPPLEKESKKEPVFEAPPDAMEWDF